MGGKRREISFTPIGIVRSPYVSRKDAPKQGFTKKEISYIEIYPEHKTGLEGIKIGDMLDLVYWMDRADRNNLWNDFKNKGIFATRGPDRPNPIGISPVEVVGIEGNVLKVIYLDALDGSFVLDIRHSLFDTLDGLKIKEF